MSLLMSVAAEGQLRETGFVNEKRELHCATCSKQISAAESDPSTVCRLCNQFVHCGNCKTKHEDPWLEKQIGQLCGIVYSGGAELAWRCV